MDQTLDSTLSTSRRPPSDKPIAQQLADEQARATKLGVLLAALEQLSVDDLKLPESSVRHFQAVVDQLLCQEFIHLPAHAKKSGIGGAAATAATMTMLGIDNTPIAHQFTYTEKKAIRAATAEAAQRRILMPAIEFVRDKRQQPAAFNVFAIERTQQEILDTERRRQRLQSELLAAEEKRCALLQQAVEMRIGSGLEDEMGLQLKRLQLNGEKVRCV